MSTVRSRMEPPAARPPAPPTKAALRAEWVQSVIERGRAEGAEEGASP
jgi:hypothetical protein